MDYSRVFQASIIVATCARNGALYASDPNVADSSPFATLQEAVLADATDLLGELNITTQEGVDVRGYGWVEVTVAYAFQTIVHYPGIDSQVNISRTVHMRKIPKSDE